MYITKKPPSRCLICPLRNHTAGVFLRLRLANSTYDKRITDDTVSCKAVLSHLVAQISSTDDMRITDDTVSCNAVLSHLVAKLMVIP